MQTCFFIQSGNPPKLIGHRWQGPSSRNRWRPIMSRPKYTCIPERDIGPFGPYGPDWPTVCFLSFMLGVLLGGMLTV